MILRCAACGDEIMQSRIFDGKAYCTCGNTIYLNPNADSQSYINNSSFSLFVFSLFLVGAIIHIFNWDNYSLSIIPLKAKQIIGVASVPELKKIATICNIRKNSQCEIQALELVFKNDKDEREGLLRVGQIHIDNRRFSSAVSIYTTYYKSGGKNLESRYPYAVALGEDGQFNEAKKQYVYLLQANKNFPKFHVAKSYVKLLVKNKEYNTAKMIIERYQKSSKSSALFLQTELAFINKNLSNYYAKSKSL